MEEEEEGKAQSKHKRKYKRRRRENGGAVFEMISMESRLVTPMLANCIILLLSGLGYIFQPVTYTKEAFVTQRCHVLKNSLLASSALGSCWHLGGGA